MAEGWAQELKGEVVDAFSAGTDPQPVHPLAVEVMAEAGVDISSLRSKHLDELLGMEFDAVVTLCGGEGETCPVYPGKAKQIHHPFPDPALVAGGEEAVLQAFRKVRDGIREIVVGMPENINVG